MKDDCTMSWMIKCDIDSQESPCTGGLKILHAPIETCRKCKKKKKKERKKEKGRQRKRKKGRKKKEKEK